MWRPPRVPGAAGRVLPFNGVPASAEDAATLVCFAASELSLPSRDSYSCPEQGKHKHLRCHPITQNVAIKK